MANWNLHLLAKTFNRRFQTVMIPCPSLHMQSRKFPPMALKKSGAGGRAFPSSQWAVLRPEHIQFLIKFLKKPMNKPCKSLQKSSWLITPDILHFLWIPSRTVSPINSNLLAEKRPEGVIWFGECRGPISLKGKGFFYDFFLHNPKIHQNSRRCLKWTLLYCQF